MFKKIGKVGVTVLLISFFSLSLYALTNEEKLELLEAKLLKGEIDQKSFRELRKKYLEQAAPSTTVTARGEKKQPGEVQLFSDNVNQGEIIISEFNDLTRWKVSCDNPRTKAKLSIEKYDQKFREGCLKLEFEGKGGLYLKFMGGKPCGGTPKFLRVWTKGEDLESTRVKFEGVFRSPEGATKNIWLARHLQPYWMINTGDFRFKEQMVFGGDVLSKDGLTKENAVGGSGLHLRKGKDYPIQSHHHPLSGKRCFQ